MSISRQLEQSLQAAVANVVFGAEDAVRALAIALVVRGHVLLQGVPGIGKTLLSKTIAAALGGSFQRIQGTADLMPSDITGVNVFNRATGRFEFQPGPVFADVVLVDEINRAGPKTQSALLEAMEERQVTVDRDTHRLADNFFVIATQNPRELEGTYPLPESQLDRFVMRIDMSYPAPEHEAQAIARYGDASAAAGGWQRPAMLEQGLLEAAREESARLEVTAELLQYAMDLARATRESDRLSLGLSTRGIIALMRCARVEAAIAGRDYVTPDDIKQVAPLVMRHRLLFTPEALLTSADTLSCVTDILAAVDLPR